ncbi:MAG: hypothetical protein ACRC1H_14045 [Caldilineaceae bacterium]
MYAPGPSGRSALDGIISFLAIVGLITIFCLGFLLALVLTGGF